MRQLKLFKANLWDVVQRRKKSPIPAKAMSDPGSTQISYRIQEGRTEVRTPDASNIFLAILTVL